MVNNDKSGKPRGYAFIEFESERDMRGMKGKGRGWGWGRMPLQTFLGRYIM